MAAIAAPRDDVEFNHHARQNGIHASPTFVVDGLVRAGLSSGDPVDGWIAKVFVG